MVDIENYLRMRIEAHLNEIGLGDSLSLNGSVPAVYDKDTYRNAHLSQRLAKINDNAKFIEKKGRRLLQYFASGEGITVSNIKPRLIPIKSDSWESDLFRLACLYWRVPVSVGYGRRIRFLVWDEFHNKLMGVIGLGDAVFNLKARDELVGWTHHDRKHALVKLMDAYVLGAIPPYNQLLGGKLVACLIRSREVVGHFNAKYKDKAGIISGETKCAQLVMVTTSSALGRSSIYNRLKLQGLNYFKPIGYTAGWGHFHFSDELFQEMRVYLELLGDKYANNHAFGQGPNWRMRSIKKVLNLLGFKENSARHGLMREIFVCETACNAINVLKGLDVAPDYSNLLSVEQIGEQAKERWLLPRAASKPDYLNWKSEMFLEEIRG